MTYMLSESGFLGFLSRSHNFGLRVSRLAGVTLLDLQVVREWNVMPAFVSVACCVTCRISEREMLCQLLSCTVVRIYHHFIRVRNVTSVFGLHDLRN